MLETFAPGLVQARASVVMVCDAYSSLYHRLILLPVAGDWR